MPERPHILLIEDDAHLGMLLEHMLSKHYQVTTLTDGFAALSWLAGGHMPHMIMADVDMPGLGSAQLLENIKVSGFYRHLPVVILSGKSDTDKAESLLRQGADAVLQKPFSREDLFELLQRLLRFT
jgi:two-component system chemotaxis response regulator CheY